MRRGFLYLVAVMDWFSRRVLAWRLSNTMEVDFCIEAIEEAMARFGRPAIFNSDQGSQFTSPRFTELLIETSVRISMDGRGRWIDNVFIERLWRSLKYECIYLNAFETGSEARVGRQMKLPPALPCPECYRLNALPQGRCYRERSISWGGGWRGGLAWRHGTNWWLRWRPGMRAAVGRSAR